jgi:hypothetical protein
MTPRKESYAVRLLVAAYILSIVDLIVLVLHLNRIVYSNDLIFQGIPFLALTLFCWSIFFYVTNYKTAFAKFKNRVFFSLGIIGALFSWILIPTIM